MSKSETKSNQENESKLETGKRRRAFTTEYKLSILQQADQCKHGELGVLLRREGLYSNQLAQWRRELITEGVEKLAKSKPGPKPSQSPEQKRIVKLEQENARLRKQLQVKEDCIQLQKKVLTLSEQIELSS